MNKKQQPLVLGNIVALSILQSGVDLPCHICSFTVPRPDIHTPTASRCRCVPRSTNSKSRARNSVLSDYGARPPLRSGYIKLPVDCIELDEKCGIANDVQVVTSHNIRERDVLFADLGMLQTVSQQAAVNLKASAGTSSRVCLSVSVSVSVICDL
jgi:hypothetical protein